MNNGAERRPTSGVAGFLAFAATPLCIMMALMTGLAGSHHSAHDLSWLTGMAAMYVLMGVLHSVPWLDRLSRW